MLKKFFIFFFFIFSITAFSQTELSLIFNKTFDKDTRLLVYVYNSEKGFPSHKENIYRKEIINIIHTNRIVIENLPFGEYAIIVVVDKNKNNQMDRNWLGLPAEPYVLSGHPKFHFGPPRFNEVKFLLNKKKQSIQLNF